MTKTILCDCCAQGARWQLRINSCEIPIVCRCCNKIIIDEASVGSIRLCSRKCGKLSAHYAIDCWADETMIFMKALHCNHCGVTNATTVRFERAHLKVAFSR